MPAGNMDSRAPPKRTVSILNSVAQIATGPPSKKGPKEPHSVEFPVSSGVGMSDFASSLLAQDDAFLWHEVRARLVKHDEK